MRGKNLTSKLKDHKVWWNACQGHTHGFGHENQFGWKWA